MSGREAAFLRFVEDDRKFSIENRCVSNLNSIDKIVEVLCRKIDWKKINDKIGEKRIGR